MSEEKLPKWNELPIGLIAIEPGSSAKAKKWFWREQKPILNWDKCTGCGWCWVYCPEGAVKPKDKKYEIDYDYCKGCGICAEECPVKAIEMVEEVE